MAKTINKLTPMMVSKVSKPGLYGDGAGLHLQVGPTGAKSWIFRFMRDGRSRAMGLGPVHTVNMTEARAQATDSRKLLLEGQDPIDVRNTAKLARKLQDASAMTFKLCAEKFIATHRAGWRNAKHAAQWESTLRDYVYPTVGDLPVAAIDTPLVMKCLTQIWTEKTETATRVRGRIESILDWATTSNYRQGENSARWRGHLKNILPPPSKLAKVTHHPALPYTEIAALMTRTSRAEGSRRTCRRIHHPDRCALW